MWGTQPTQRKPTQDKWKIFKLHKEMGRTRVRLTANPPCCTCKHVWRLIIYLFHRRSKQTSAGIRRNLQAAVGRLNSDCFRCTKSWSPATDGWGEDGARGISFIQFTGVFNVLPLWRLQWYYTVHNPASVGMETRLPVSASLRLISISLLRLRDLVRFYSFANHIQKCY